MFVDMVVIGVLFDGFNMKDCFLDLLLLLIFIVGVFDFLYIGLFLVCDFLVMNVESFFSVGFFLFVFLWYNLVDFFYLVCRGFGRWLKICCILVV